MTVRAAIVGTGFMGRVHARSVVTTGNDVVGVLGSAPGRATALAATLRGAVAVATMDDLLALEPDVVHICTPNALHHDQALAVLEAGVGVVVEKPLATSVADAAALAERAGSVGVAAVPFVYRYHPVVREIRQRIAARPDNRLWMLHGSYLQDWLADPSARNWRIDADRGGASRAFGDIGVHWCDLMEFVTGQRITRLSARLGTAFERGAATEDGGVVQFETDGGALGSLVVSQASAGRANRLWFSFDGPDESYAFDQEQPETAWIGRQGETAVIRRDPSAPGGRPGALPAGHAQGYQHCFDDFVTDAYAAHRGAVVDGLPTFDDGLRAAVLTEAVVASHRASTWVDVPAPAPVPVPAHLQRTDHHAA